MMTTPGASMGALPTTTSSPDPPSLVGRTRERAILRGRLAAALAGQGGLVLIGGEAGLGKTALAEELGREAVASGTQFVAARCYDHGETPPYGPWADCLDLLPATPARPTLPTSRDAWEAGADDRLLARRVLDYLAGIARPALVLLLDDLHWADPGSLDLLRVVCRHLGALPILVLATYRGEDLTRHHSLVTHLPAFARERGATRLDLRPLDDKAVGAYVRAQYPLVPADESRLLAHLAGRAEGNPFYLGELLRSLQDEGLLAPTTDGWRVGDLVAARLPALLRQVVDRRLDRLGDEARRHLAVAAVIGQEVPLDLWERVADLDEEALLVLRERAVAARLLDETPDGSRARFPHALIREALYEGTLPSRRRHLHRLAAEVMAGMPVPDPDAVASHFRRAGDLRAIPWLLRAGERAYDVYAWLTAAERFGAALDLMQRDAAAGDERAALALRLALLRRYAAPRESLDLVREAHRLALAAGDLAIAGAARCCEGMLRAYVGEYRPALAALREAVVALDAYPVAPVPADPLLPLDGLSARALLVNWLAVEGNLGEVEVTWADLASRCPFDARDAGAVPRAYAYPLALAQLSVGGARAGLGRPEAARPAFALSRALSAKAGHHYLAHLASALELAWSIIPFAADRVEERERLAAAVERDWAWLGGVQADLPSRVARLPLLHLDGQWEEARDLAETVRATPGTSGWRWVAVTALASLAAARGDAALVAALVAEVLPAGLATAPGDAHLFLALPCQRAAAAVALAVGDLTGARAWLDAHDRWLARSGAMLGRAEGELLRAECERATGNRAAAGERAARALALAGAPRQPLALLAARRLLGDLALGEGRREEARVHLDAALALADACAAPYERALTLLSLARLRAADGDRGAALALLVEAEATCARLGAAPAQARLATLIAEVGDATPAVGPGWGLTAREAEVLRLVARGLTNREAAERLALSPRTVGAHLNAIYGKMGVATRTAAAREAIRRGLA